MKTERRTITLGAAVIAIVASFLAGAYVATRYRVAAPDTFAVGDAVAAPESAPAPKAETVPGPAVAPKANTVELLETQLTAVKVEVASERQFPLEKQAVGSIDFNEEMVTPIFTPYQGRIVGLFAKVGDEVQKGQTLFTIDSPDLLAADSSLISSAGVLQLTTRNLARLRSLYASRAVSQKDLEQAISDQQTAEGALRAARDAVRIFGKTDAEIDKIVAERIADPTLVVLIRTGEPMRSVAVPYDGVVREGDGTMTVWVTADRRRFTQRRVKVGLLRDGYYQLLEGLQPGELVATEGALFLSNALAIAAR
jgi:membrane fusion protein, heavy metal efflux system